MTKALRTVVPVVAVAALAAAGCMLISGQFVVNFALQSPLKVVDSPLALTSVDVDLNTVSDYKDHKDDLKRVEDLALVGDFHNNRGAAAALEAWIVPSGALTLSESQVRTQGSLLWGPLALGPNATEHVDWNRSSTLFKGRQALIDEIKGDGHFSLYLMQTGTFDVTVTDGAVIAVVAAAK